MAEEYSNDTHQYLTFMLAEEIFALDIGTVREVLELTTITKVPRTPDFMRGVINLRGHAVPVMDMRVKFGMDKTEDTVNTCIIIVEVEFEDEAVVMGAVADSVREVLEIMPDEIDHAPRMGTAIDTDFIRGMARQGDAFIMILDIDRVFSVQELTLAMSANLEAPAPTQAVEATPTT